MAKLEDLTCIEDVQDLCLVTKSWRAAFVEYSAEYRYHIMHNQLQGLLALQPKLTGLTISSSKQHSLKLKPLMTAPNLTSLTLYGSTYTNNSNESLEPRVKLSQLPSALKELVLNSVYADPDHFQNIQCTGISSLVFQGRQNKLEEVLGLLQQLPKLQVRKC